MSRSAVVFFLGDMRVWHLLFFTCLYFVFGMIVNPAWNSWMGDLVVENRRGAYFGRRSKVTSTASFLALIAAGYILRQFEGGGHGQAVRRLYPYFFNCLD